jgi:alkylation response protein AidB-like acyl-CoA dehydrogenase
MTTDLLMQRLRKLIQSKIPLPGSGETALRHRILIDVGREDLSLARLAEAHWDAVAILAEAGRQAEPDALYGVWASEKPGSPISLEGNPDGLLLSGTKMFCSGAGLLDRVLLTAGGPEPFLVDVDLRAHMPRIVVDDSAWKTSAFAATKTATVTFNEVPITSEDILGNAGWYLKRPGFWHGACGPAACWAGGAEGLLDYAMEQRRSDPHTLAHLGAMSASIWAMQAFFEKAGNEIDEHSEDFKGAMIRALTLRHLVEEACTNTLRRIVRAYGPHPLAIEQQCGQRYTELDLYLRQSHAERDLEALGAALLQQPAKG